MSADQIIREPGASLGHESMTESSIHVRNEKARNYLDIITLIRSIQRSEGNPDCFLKGNADCDQLNCAWRPYCLGKEPKG
jgi:hypothetical protein